MQSVQYILEKGGINYIQSSTHKLCGNCIFIRVCHFQKISLEMCAVLSDKKECRHKQETFYTFLNFFREIKTRRNNRKFLLIEKFRVTNLQSCLVQYALISRNFHNYCFSTMVHQILQIPTLFLFLVHPNIVCIHTYILTP